MKKLFTSESVTEGHPDKVCDILSDSVLDAHLAVDALHGRRVHIDISIAELVAETSSCAREDVLLAGIEVDREVGQAFAQTQLVDVAFIALLLSLYVHLIEVVEYVLHGARTINTQHKVATRHVGMC